MSPRVVMVTGVSRYLGGRLAQALAADPSIERVIGVDSVPPLRGARAGIGRTEFVRADIRNPLISKVIAAAGVDTIVHMNISSTPNGDGGRIPMKELNVIGTMQLLAACQNAYTVSRLVVKSTSAVYGASPRDPALFTEDMPPKSVPGSGFAKDAAEIESYVRGFSRRRPDVAVSVLRFSNFIGPRIDSILTSYFALPIVPTILGYDARLQLLHEDDAVEILRRVAVSGSHFVHGVTNVGGDGVLLLSQAIRRAGRLSIPVPPPAARFVGRAIRRLGLADFSPEQMRFLNFGRVMDLTRMKEIVGFQPQHTTAQAFADYVRGRGLKSIPPRGILEHYFPSSDSDPQIDGQILPPSIRGRS